MGAPQSRDTAVIGSPGGATVTLNDGGSHKTGDVWIGCVPDGSDNFAAGTLTISNHSTLRTVQDVLVASAGNWNEAATTGSLNLTSGATLNVGREFELANQDNATASLSLTNYATLNVGGDVYLGHGNKSVTIDPTSQLNMIGGGNLYLDNETFGVSGALPLVFSNTAAGGYFSVQPTTSLWIRQQWGNAASLTLDANSSGVQFGGLNLATDTDYPSAPAR